jgi:hypothetical protein
MNPRSFYLTRAKDARADAEAAELVNVRNRWLRAEAAWIEMADRAGRIEKARIEREQATASQL